jgi:hypothetical protein
MKYVVLTSVLAKSCLFTAKLSDNLFLSPLDNPISNIVIQPIKEVIVSQTPYRSGLIYLIVIGTNKNDKTILSPLNINDNKVLMLANLVRVLA